MSRQEVLFVSDLHLAFGQPATTRRFLDFLKKRAHKAQALYILGDLFDVWIGDDDPTPPNNAVRRTLKQLVESGTQVYFQPGNRDFLVGPDFCQESGVTLLEDYAVIDLFGVPTLLMHGDLLCTDDVAYQTFRVKSHSETWRRSVLTKPLALRWLAARWYRWRSFWHKRHKTLAIMDVNQAAVVATMRRYGCRRLIHGHTHRPGLHEFELDGYPAQRHVLAAWLGGLGRVLSWQPNGYRIENI
jgi:UDP-2,3-diacylglucosamine hydrolase